MCAVFKNLPVVSLESLNKAFNDKPNPMLFVEFNLADPNDESITKSKLGYIYEPLWLNDTIREEY